MSTASYDSGAGATGEYYCEICDVKMNAFSTYESHVSGKKHLKNLQKNTGTGAGKDTQDEEEPAPIRAKIEEALDDVTEPIIGLSQVTETQYPDSTIHPSYYCHLCGTQLGIMGVVDHVTSTKHRLNYIKENDTDGHIIMESMKESKVPLDGIAQERAVTLEKMHGRGNVQVKIEKSKFGYLASMRKRRQDNNEGSPQKKFNINEFRRYDVDDDYEAKTEQFLRRIPYFDTDTKLQIIERLSLPMISNDEEAKVVLSIITMIEQLLMHKQLQNLCASGKEGYGRSGNMGGMDAMRLNMQQGLPRANLGPRSHPMGGASSFEGPRSHPMGDASNFEGSRSHPMGGASSFEGSRSHPMGGGASSFEGSRSHSMGGGGASSFEGSRSYPTGGASRFDGPQMSQSSMTPMGRRDNDMNYGFQSSYSMDEPQTGYQSGSSNSMMSRDMDFRTNTPVSYPIGRATQGSGSQQGQFSSNRGKPMNCHWGRFN